ncbi:hypothetical protein [Desulfoscipio geothermicus]|uniref:Uncharacterized protein n=1 Tax=Desulfoscipio geothermicus DSM 3669 TaxID=1121426 RepID=A0A1I6E2D9_9FIRM|nr:hypothetical protein [Desulfoscipio geothermicus]SFR11787.1 hypothetical protein SAMN05660706_12368 [Desulfoscipio geothermicus DSM 3669]
MFEQIDQKIVLFTYTLTATLLFKFIYNIFNTVGMIDVQKFLSSKDKKFFLIVNEFLGITILMISMTTSFLAIFNEHNWITKFLKNPNTIIYLIAINLILLIITWLLGAIYIIHQEMSRTFIKINIYKNLHTYLEAIENLTKRTHPYLNAITCLSCLLFFPVYSANYIVYLINKYSLSTKIEQCIAFNLLMYIIAYLIYRFYLYQETLYRKPTFKIVTIKTNDGQVFHDLYLYNHDDKHIFLGSEPNHITSNEYLVVSKEAIKYYLIKLEIYSWGKKVISEHGSSIYDLNIERPSNIIKF